MNDGKQRLGVSIVAITVFVVVVLAFLVSLYETGQIAPSLLLCNVFGISNTLYYLAGVFCLFTLLYFLALLVFQKEEKLWLAAIGVVLFLYIFAHGLFEPFC